METVFVGMSGGVDSSVTAGILRDQGYNVVGVHLRCWNVDGCAEQDAEDARRAAETLGIPFYVFDFEKEYREKVVEYMVSGYKKGITPNPDVMCNQEIKFGLFFKRAMELGADYVATGHYVRLRSKRVISNSKLVISKKVKSQLPITSYQLLIAKDADKDQSYFLWTLTQQQLKHCLFPLGGLIKKTDVRRLARKYKLPNAEKKDSQGICFLGRVKLDEFLGHYIKPKAGQVRLAQPNGSYAVIGEHRGVQFYTIGQRHGLGIGGFSTPHYVADKDMRRNTIVLAPENDPALYKKEVALTKVNFLSPKLQHTNKLKNVGMSVWCRVRYRQPLVRAKLEKSKIWKVIFDEPVKSVALGQSAVFYAKSGELIGGGIISSAF